MKKIKLSKKYIESLKIYLQLADGYEDEYRAKLFALESKMAKLTNIEDIEFFFCDGELVGIGNASRTMKLIQREELE